MQQSVGQSSSIWQPTATRLKGLQATLASLPAVELCQSPTCSIVGTSTVQLTDRFCQQSPGTMAATACPLLIELSIKPGM